ncbi:Integrator complex subunit 2 [Trichinella pseudospiralis]|uniref:N-terminal acetyltransferase B complex subunit MDM20 homolog n=1 Tax=Trichinella pseudospiralis TaxID=6337 RepID=A0A0V1JWB6_TRIPS|nr:Integrator complex subunit 2 [Trichinella pseudospiralis]
MSYLQIVRHLLIFAVMNSRPTMEAIFEKRARSIYELLDKGNMKRAIQDCDKFIKKYPQAPIAKALKTLCLIRHGRSGETDKLIEACFQCGPIDQLAMQALSYCFRELGKPNMLVVLYQRMLDQNPNNEEYMASLSLSHGRAGDFKMFGLQAMQLYKQVPNERYYFWSVMSNVFQAHGQSESAMTVHLPLAQKMTVKYIKEHRNNINDNIIQLYLFILKMGSHHNEALRFLQSDLIQPEIHSKIYLAEEQLAAWERLGRHEEAFEFSKERIRMKKSDGWPLWNKMIDNFLCLLEANQERRKRLFENFIEFFDERIEERSTHLAKLYLVEKLIEKNLATVDELESFKLDVPAKLIAKYFEAFAHKPCFFDDVRPFLKLVIKSERNDFVSELAKIAGDLPITFHDSQIEMSFVKNQEVVQKHVHLLHICSVVGCYSNLSTPDLLQFSKQLLILFDRARRYNTTQSHSSAYPSDGYLSLAVHFIWLLYIMKQDDHWLYRLAILLEQRLSLGKPNYEFVFRLSKVYSLLGCPGALLRVFNGSDIKMIMMESLWYMMNDQLTPWGFYREYIMWCTSCVEFYSRTSRDVLDNMVVALREGNYMKSIELFRFRDAYDVSANNLLCRVRRQYYHLISEFQDFETLRESFLRAMTKDMLFDGERIQLFYFNDRLSWLDTVDRRDHCVVSQYLSLEELDSFHNWNKCVFAQMMIQTTLQWTVLRLFCSLHELYTLAEESSFCEIQADPSSAGTNDQTLYMAHLKEDEPRPLRNAFYHASQMRPIYADGVSLDETQYEMVMYGSPVCYFGLYCRGHYFDLFELVLQTCLQYVQKAWLLVRGVEAEDPRLKEDSLIFPKLDNLKERMRTMFCDHQFKENSDLFPHMQLVHISFLLETFSLCMLVCLAAKSIATLIYPHVTKKTKKKNFEGRTGLAQLNENFADFCNVIALGTDTPFQMIADMQDLLEAESPLLRRSCAKWSETMDMRRSASLFETNLRESYSKSLKYMFLLSTNHHSMAAMLLRSRGGGGGGTGGGGHVFFEIFIFYNSTYTYHAKSSNLHNSLTMIGVQSCSLATSAVVEQLYRAVLSSDLEMLCSSGQFSVANLSMVYPYLLTRVFGVDIGRALSHEGKNLLNKLVVDKRALDVFHMKLASVETTSKVEPQQSVVESTTGTAGVGGGLHFENCTPSEKLMLVRCEVAKAISAWHHARRTGTPVKQRSYCAADSEQLVDDFCDALFMLCYGNFGFCVDLHILPEVLLLYHNGPLIVQRLTMNGLYSVGEVADLMIRNAETSAEAYEERMWLIIRREKTLQYLCALAPECSSLLIRSAVEQLKLLGFVLQASMCYYSFEKLLSTLLQLIENNETLLWFFQFVKLSQKPFNRYEPILTQLKAHLLCQMETLASAAASNDDTLPIGDLSLALNSIKLFTKLRFLVGLRWTDDECRVMMKLLLKKAEISTIGAQFHALGLVALIAFGCQQNDFITNFSDQLNQWFQYLIAREEDFDKCLSKDVNSGYGDVLLLIAIHIVCKSVKDLQRIVKRGLNIHVSVLPKHLDRIRERLPSFISDKQFIVRQAAKVRVTRELSAKITDVLPIDCVIALLHWRAFSRYQVHISDWIFKQLSQCCTPISDTTVELIEMFVHSCLNPYIENEHASSSPIINPFAESKLIAFYKETALQTEHFVMQVLLLYYILYYENYYNENIRKFDLIDTIPVQYIIIQIELHGRDYSALFIKILKCAVNLYSYLIFPMCLKIPRLASDVPIPSVDAIREGLYLTCPHSYLFSNRSVDSSILSLAARCSKKFPKKSLAMLRKLRRCNPGGLFELLPELTNYVRYLLDSDVAFALQQEYLSLWNYMELFYSRKLHGHTVASLKPSGTGAKFYSHTSLCDDIKQIVVCDVRVFKVAPIFKILLRVLHCYFSAARLALEQKIVINALVGGGKRKSAKTSTPTGFEDSNTSVSECVRQYAILNEVICIQALLDSCMPDDEQVSIEEREVLVHLCNFLHQVFIAEPLLIKAIHHQGYSTKLISIIVRNVPSMHVCFDWIKELITMSDLQIKIFSIELLSHLCVEHPIDKAYRCAEFLLNVLYTMIDKLESKQVLRFCSKILQATMRICRVFQPLVLLAYKLFDKASTIVNVNCGDAVHVLPTDSELREQEEQLDEDEKQSSQDAASLDIAAAAKNNLKNEKEQFLTQVRSAFQQFIGHGLIDIAD